MFKTIISCSTRTEVSHSQSYGIWGFHFWTALIQFWFQHSWVLLNGSWYTRGQQQSLWAVECNFKKPLSTTCQNDPCLIRFNVWFLGVRFRAVQLGQDRCPVFGWILRKHPPATRRKHDQFKQRCAVAQSPRSGENLYSSCFRSPVFSLIHVCVCKMFGVGNFVKESGVCRMPRHLRMFGLGWFRSISEVPFLKLAGVPQASCTESDCDRGECGALWTQGGVVLGFVVVVVVFVVVVRVWLTWTRHVVWCRMWHRRHVVQEGAGMGGCASGLAAVDKALVAEVRESGVGRWREESWEESWEMGGILGGARNLVVVPVVEVARPACLLWFFQICIWFVTHAVGASFGGVWHVWHAAVFGIRRDGRVSEASGRWLFGFK